MTPLLSILHLKYLPPSHGRMEIEFAINDPTGTTQDFYAVHFVLSPTIGDLGLTNSAFIPPHSTHHPNTAQQLNAILRPNYSVVTNNGSQRKITIEIPGCDPVSSYHCDTSDRISAINEFRTADPTIKVSLDLRVYKNGLFTHETIIHLPFTTYLTA